MYKYFDIDTQKDPNFLGVAFKKDEECHNVFIMDIDCISKQAADELKGRLIGLGRICKMDTSHNSQDFTIRSDDKNSEALIVTGNLSLALTILKDYKLFSEHLCETIVHDKEIAEFLSNSDKFELSTSDRQTKKNDFFTFSSSSSQGKNMLEKELHDVEEELKKEVEQKLLVLSNKYDFSPDTEKKCKERLANSILGISINRKEEIPTP